MADLAGVWGAIEKLVINLLNLHVRVYHSITQTRMKILTWSLIWKNWKSRKNQSQPQASTNHHLSVSKGGGRREEGREGERKRERERESERGRERMATGIDKSPSFCK